ncbi:hypothetical protein SAMN05216481_11950 [Streptomyces radiopugnans]|uniref:Uncharacterized protein n=1 Tax=Streptomyces radiopugnans TaxID=403935 RepID=A0A1H9JUT7_9ACTN|nr:hypothetical protein SAMN05216481_11950 [Streptomyces radiopugnans]
MDLFSVRVHGPKVFGRRRPRRRPEALIGRYRARPPGTEFGRWALEAARERPAGLPTTERMPAGPLGAQRDRRLYTEPSWT